MKKSKKLLYSLFFVMSLNECAVSLAGLNGGAPSSPHPSIIHVPQGVSSKPAAQNITQNLPKPVSASVSQAAPSANHPVVSQPAVVHPAPAQPIVQQPQTITPMAVSPAIVSSPQPAIQPAQQSSPGSKTNVFLNKEHHDDKNGNDDSHYSVEEVSHEVHASPLDTSDLMSSGNWILKRAWWEKTEDVYEQLKDVISKILELRPNFLHQRNEIDRMFDICFSEVGLEQGELIDIVGYAKDLLDKEKAQGLVVPEQKAFAEKLAGKERELEQLKLDIQGITDIEKKIEEALEMFFGQIDTCNKYEHKAWENFKDIARELDDKEARKLYYNTEALLKDIKNIENYLQHDFTTYFNVMVQAAKDHTQKISAQVNSLKASDIDLKKELKVLEEHNSAKVKDPQKKAAEDKLKAEKAEKKRQEELEKSKWYYPVKMMYEKVKTYAHEAYSLPFLASIKHGVSHGLQKVVELYVVAKDYIVSLFSKNDVTAVSAKAKKKTSAKKEELIKENSTKETSQEPKQEDKKENKQYENQAVKKDDTKDEQQEAKKVTVAKAPSKHPKQAATAHMPVKDKDMDDTNTSADDDSSKHHEGYYDKPIKPNDTSSDINYYHGSDSAAA